MSRFNIRAITAAPMMAPTLITDKKPSAYAAMKGGHAAPSVIAHVEEEPKKKGRPTKDELRKRKLALASEGVAALLAAKPTKAKIRDYIQNRIEQLDLEKL